jgi:alpha-glucosidase (family GH31 glycosyl hydrolase)
MWNSIQGILDMNMFGIALIGADICGYLGNTTAEMCARWTALGSFYPFARNHYDNSTMTPHETWEFGPEITAINRKMLQNRYSLIPYFYTLFFRSHTQGGMVVYPLFFQFPLDHTTYSIDRQFMLGNHILITPTLIEGDKSVKGYFPDNAVWYNWWDGTKTSTGWIILPSPLDVINVHIRGGGIIPRQEPAMNTELMKYNPYYLTIALNNQHKASGELFIDDGESDDAISSRHYTLINYTAEFQNSILIVQSSFILNGYHEITRINMSHIIIMGFNWTPADATVNGKIIPKSNLQYDHIRKVLKVTLMINMNTTWKLIVKV